MLSWTVPLGGPTGWHRVAVAVGHKLYIFGEAHDDLGFPRFRPRSDWAGQISVYVLNTVALRWRNLSARWRRGETMLRPEVPRTRRGHSAVLVGHIVYIWGGEVCLGGDERVYAFDADNHRWLKTEVSGSLPGPRFRHSACVLEKAMYVHGGQDLTHFTRPCDPCNNVYKLDTSTMVWSSLISGGPLPPPSSHHSATIIGTKMFVVGGCSLNSIRVFDTETNLWLSMTPSAQLPGCERAFAAAFAYNGELYVFVLFGLWKFHTKTFSWKKLEPKGKGPSGAYPTGCCCMLGERVFLSIFSNDLYILDLSPSLQTLCKLAVIQHDLDKSELPHDIRWELADMISAGNWQQVEAGGRWELESDGNWKKVIGSKWEMTAGGNWQRTGKGSHDVSQELAGEMSPKKY